MAFPPQFLDEIRARISLPDLIGGRVKLTKKGREHSGLCPFHNEKSPSFTISEEKGFFHCFGCGAHGDAIGFVMRADGLSFPEAVERLAQMAGLEVPQATPAERERARRQADLHEVMEKACAFFEDRLRAPAGGRALDYLRGRGLDDETMARFRLGFAPDSRGALREALMSETMPESMLVEAGLLIRPDDGRAPYDRFRGRVIFPITDRRGRVIAFGGRILGDGKPKYLNSPDTPLFDKGRVLYGLATARRAAFDSGRIVVTEGYMDVIALARAGFTEAVAPMGTALTENQLHELWRLAPEPVLCFDGDEAGRRAAWRAAERALPLLEAGRSLFFVTLPKGEDPDSLISAQGAGEMRKLFEAARPLAATIWDMETAGQRLDSPERLAGLEKRLKERAFSIADRNVQEQYLAVFRQKLRDFTAPARPGRQRGAGRRGAANPRMALGAGAGARAGTGVLRRRVDQVVVATMVNHSDLIDEFAERLVEFKVSDPKLANLLREILLVYAGRSGLDSGALRRQLEDQGFAEVLDAVLGPDIYVHAGFARPDAPLEDARAGLEQVLSRQSEPSRHAEVDEAGRNMVRDPTDENKARFDSLKTQYERESDIRESLLSGRDDGYAASETADPTT